jgi:uncharacterized membrane protein HdeD (DUF308 family)
MVTTTHDAQHTASESTPRNRLSGGSRVWYAISGIAFLVVAGLALMEPFAASLAANIWIGSLLAVLGVIEVFSAFRRHDGWGVFSEAAVGVLTAVGGVLAIVFPLSGLLAFTAIIIMLFIVSGAVRIALAFRRRSSRLWGFRLASGVIGLGLGLYLWFYLPASALVTLGALLAVDLAFFGAALLIAAAWGEALLPAAAKE